MTRNDIAASLVDCCNAWLANEAIVSPRTVFDDDLVLKVLGRTPLSGEYRGLNEVQDVFLSTLKARVRNGSLKLLEVIGKGPSIALIVEIALQGVNGRVYNAQRDCDVAICDIRDGKIREIRLHPDTKEIQTAIFSATYTLPRGDKA